MRFGNLTRLFAALGFGLALLLSAPALVAAPVPEKEKGKDKESNGKAVTFKTVDGVELSGTYWKAAKDGKDATVLLLHDFSKTKGGDSHQDDMDKLGDLLNDQGFAVLSFDFRGFGRSKDVSPDQFWASQNNKLIVPPGFNPRSPASSIDSKTFPPQYFLHLVDDVNAAKAYLDRKSIAKELNSSNLIVIGAGQGATIGMMWVYGQHRLVRQKGVTPQGRPDIDEPEGKDIICTMWLTMSPKVEGINIPIAKYMEDMEKKYKLPMVFLYGDGDTAAETEINGWLKSVMPSYKMMGAKGIFNETDKTMKFTRDLALPNTKLTGSKLLTSDLPTADNIKDYLDKYLKERGGLRDARRVEIEKFPYLWVPLTGGTLPAKAGGGTVTEENIRATPLRVLLLGGN